MPTQTTDIEVTSQNGINFTSSETWVVRAGVLILTEAGYGIASTFNGSVLSNAGRIISGESLAVSMTGLNNSINNSGSIFGDVVLGQGGDRYDGRGGVLHGTVFGKGGRDTLLGGSEEIDIRCRLIAAANPLLEQAVSTGAFREDLFYRLNVFTITLPALRERQEDITLIARQCLAESVNENGRVKVLSPEALETLHTHRWPGNVRELRNIIERAAILSGDERTILPEHLLIQRRTASSAGDFTGASTRGSANA